MITGGAMEKTVKWFSTLRRSVTYLVAVDGVGGETGTVQLNHELSQAPVIDSITENADGLLDGTVKLEVQASSPLADADLTYKWRRDGNIIDGINGEVLVIDNIQYTDAGDYTVEISSFAGSVTSEIVPVRVIQPVSITTQPIDARGVAGGSAVLAVSVIGTDPISYEWRRGGEKVEGGDNASLTISDLVSHREEYQVVVSNPAGSVLSETAILEIEIPPAITTLTESQNVVEGETVVLSVRANGTAPLNYAWKRDGVYLKAKMRVVLPFLK